VFFDAFGITIDSINSFSGDGLPPPLLLTVYGFRKCTKSRKRTKKKTEMGIILKEESAKIVGAIFEVHKRLGVGLLEKVYQEALAIELKHRNIPFERERRFEVYYRDQKLDAQYIADFVCYGKIIVELKAVSELTDVHKAQVRNYLTITGYELGILCNFNELYMEPVRILNSNLL
jgi:GxxExxY protein